MGCVKLQILDEYYKIPDLKVRYKGKELTLKSCSETSCSGLINMNGRLYDPVISRMLSPDKFVQDQFNAQSYNKYSYVLNNPLKYTDKSGWLIDKYFDKLGNYLGDDGVGNNIRIIDRKQFDMITDYGKENLTDLESVLKMGSTLLTGYINYDDRYMGLQEDFQLKIYNHFNPTGLRLENKILDDNANMGFTNGVAGKDLKIFVNLEQNLKNNIVNNYDNVINMFHHEDFHYRSFKKLGWQQYIATPKNIREQDAIKYQMNHNSWINTSQDFKDGVIRWYKKQN